MPDATCNSATALPRSAPIRLYSVVRVAALTTLTGLCWIVASPPLAAAQVTNEPNRANQEAVPISAPAERVEVKPGAQDEQIEARLRAILDATGWFTAPKVHVDEGVVFFEGETANERSRDWASALAQRTEGVVAVVNNIGVIDSEFTDIAPALDGLQALGNSLKRSVPFILVGSFLLVASFFAGKATTWAFRTAVRRRGQPNLIRELTARGLGILVFTLGLYLALRVAGLTRLAATVLGGTGIIGLVLGIAFRDMAENVLASLLLSRQQPFSKGDLVRIDAVEGYVQRLTVRATVLMTLDGNHVQIPNATVYKSAILNFTSNPSRRIDFVVGIGYEQSIAHAQEVALTVLADHPAVLAEPEPWVLAESLGSAAVNLRVYVLLDGRKHSWLKVRSSVIRLVKRAFQAANISMPDEAREIVFPSGVPVFRMPEPPPSTAVTGRTSSEPTESVECADVSTRGEARLESDSEVIHQIAEDARTPEEGEDLLSTVEPHKR